MLERIPDGDCMIWLKQSDGSYAYYTIESAKVGRPKAIARMVGTRWQRIMDDGECVSYRTLSELKRSIFEQN